MTEASPVPDPKIERRTTIALTLLVLILTWCYWKVDTDDAYIFYTYARNIATGHGYVFNVGERILGTTSPLYSLTLAALYMGLRPLRIVTIPGIGHLVGAVGLWVAAFLGMRILRDTGLRTGALFYPLIFLASPLHRDAVGMETFLTVALVISAFYLYQRERLVGVAVVSGLAVLSRPDAIIVPVILFADYVLTRRKLPPWKCIAILVLILVAWAIFSAVYFGELLPHTLTAKVAQTRSGRWGTGFIFLRGLAELPWKVSAIFTLAALYLLFVDRSWFRHRVVVLIFLSNLLYLIAYGLVLNPPAYGWYYSPLSAGMALAPALALDSLFGRLRSRSWFNARAATVALVVVLSLAAVVRPIRTFKKGPSAKYEIYTKASAWLNDNAPDGSSLAANEIGVIGYCYRRGRIIDALGLVTPGVAEHVARGDYGWYLHEYRPDYLMFNDPPRPVLEAMVEEPWFREMYERATTISTARRAVAIYRKRAPQSALFTPL